MPTEIKGEILQPKILSVTDDRLAAYNYNFFEFTAATPENGDYAEVVANGIVYRLQPDKNGLFTFNTYEFSRELFNYKDTFDYAATTIDLNQATTIVFDIKVVLFSAFEELSQLTLTFFNGVFQRWENPLVIDDIVNLSDGLIPYWEGYPLDVSEVISNDVVRTLISDGVTLATTISAPCGIGTMIVGNTNIVGTICDNVPIEDVIKEIYSACDGIYLKWHNSKYGYSYYLFQEIGIENFNTKSLGNVKEHFSWTDRLFEMGKEGQREINIFARVDYSDREMMKSLVKSNEVYLYTGERNQLADETLWLEVETSKSKVKETNRDGIFEQPLTIKLPEEKTRTRI
jgi:hypothetical protein